VRIARRVRVAGGIIAGLVLLSGAVVMSSSLALSGAPRVSAAQAGPLSSGRVERFAGGGFGGFSGDGGPAVYAQIATPRGVAADAHGNVYIADEANLRIRRVNAKGTIRTIAGGHGQRDTGDGGAASAAGLMSPGALAVDGHGNLYVVSARENPDNTRVRVIDSAGKIRTFAGSGTSGFSGDGGPAVNAQLTHPQAVATDSAGNVYIGESARIRRVDPSGVISTFAGTGVSGLAGDGGPATAAQLRFVSALATDAHGNLYVGDGYRVRRIDHATGTIATVAGTGVGGFSGDGGPATSARLGFEVGGLAVDRYGVVYIADPTNRRVRAVDSSGIITTIAGGTKPALTPGWGGPARDAPVIAPDGLAVDTQQRLLIANGNLVWRFTRGLTPNELGQCTRQAARQVVEQQHIADSYDNQDPLAQMFCGPFTGRHSRAMVVSLSLPSCGFSFGWRVYRSVNGRWKRVLNDHLAAVLTRSGRKILEWQGILGPHDAHCFPSSARVRVWHWNGKRLVHGSWQRKAGLPKHPPGLHR
jgi:hypothetical protein